MNFNTAFNIAVEVMQTSFPFTKDIETFKEAMRVLEMEGGIQGKELAGNAREALIKRIAG